VRVLLSHVCGERRGSGDLAVRAEDQLHVGIVVDDFEAALADLSAMFGYEWSGELGGPIQVRGELVSRITQPGLERQWTGEPQTA
jgi:hypothetical protein